MLAERIGDLAFGAPLGSHPLTRVEPYEVFAARRDRRLGRLTIAVLAALLLCLTVMVASAWAANKPGYWLASAPTGAVAGVDKVKWYWHAENGETAAQFTYGGRTYSSPDNFIEAAAGPSGAPDGWFKVYANSWNSQQLEGNKEKPLTDPSEGNNMAGKPIKGNNPDFVLDAVFLTNWVMKALYEICYTACGTLLSLCDWLLGLVGLDATELLSEPFSGGAFADFYAVADNVSVNAVRPYALTFLGVAYALAILRTADTRRQAQGRNWVEDAMAVTAVFAVCTTLILHATDLCASIYWLAQNLVTGIGLGLEAIGMAPSELGAGTVSETFMAGMDAVTYDQGGMTFVYLVLALVAVAVCVGAVFSILTMIFLRMGEIYLRAAASPLCLSFMVDERGRAMGMGYAKRFVALCFQAAVIFVALALAPLFFGVAEAFIAGVGLGGLGGLEGVMAALLPTVTAVTCVAQIVKRSEFVANSMFGLG